MQYQIEPPSSWIINNNKNYKLNLFETIFSNYKESDILFKIIKEDLQIINLSKKDCIKKSKYLATEILEKIANKQGNDQIKIMGILGASEESVIFMLASLLLGSHHCICFEDLSEEAIIQRINLFKPDLILSKIKLENKINKLKKKISDQNIKSIIIDTKCSKNFQNHNLEQKPRFYNNESYLFTLFTSGSTGVPKAIVHGGKDFIDYAKFTSSYYFGLKKGSIMFSAVDAGWINGHTYSFYGPLLLGAQSIINEYPLLLTMPKLLGKYLEKLRPDCFYTSVTLFRLIKSLTPPDKSISDYFEDKKSSYRVNRIGSCGEPLAHSVGDWCTKFFQPIRKSIVNTYFQTETGGIISAPRDEDEPPNDYSCVGKPFKNIKIVLAKDIKNKSELVNEELNPNELLICNNWGGIFKKVISDRKQDYFTKTGEYRLHDIGYFDKKGYLFIGGRIDDVINVSGHRISSSEIENICMNIKNVNEVCAVAAPDKLAGFKVILFFSSSFLEKEELDSIRTKLNDLIFKKLSQYHIPKKIYHFKNFPKTKSGKIMRRVMRSLLEKRFDEKKDYSSIANKNKFFISKDIFLKEFKN